MNYRGTVYYVAGIVTALTFFTFKRLLYPDHGEASGPKKLKAVFFGDSITQHGFNIEISGWLCLFANWWIRRVDVINRGFSGYNSKWGVLIAEQVVVPLAPDIVFVFFGANDAVDVSVGQHVPLSDYVENMRAIAGILQQVGIFLFKTLLVLFSVIRLDTETAEHEVGAYNTSANLGAKGARDESGERKIAFAGPNERKV